MCNWGGGIYLVAILINTILFMTGTYLGYDCFIYVFSYVNPFVIIGSVGLIIFASKLQISQNPHINFIAKSSFAVYLLHASPSVFSTIYKPIVCALYNDINVVLANMRIVLFIVLIFIIAVVLDQPRKLIWIRICDKLKEKLEIVL